MLKLSRIPISAAIGIILTGAFVFAAVFAPWVAPYGEGQIVGSVRCV